MNPEYYDDFEVLGGFIPLKKTTIKRGVQNSKRKVQRLEADGGLFGMPIPELLEVLRILFPIPDFLSGQNEVFASGDSYSQSNKANSGGDSGNGFYLIDVFCKYGASTNQNGRVLSS